MSKYLLYVWIPNTDYNDSMEWCSMEYDFNVYNELNIWAIRFATMYGWDNNLFKEDSDDAIPKTDVDKITYENKIAEYKKRIKFSLYKLIDTNCSQNIPDANISKTMSGSDDCTDIVVEIGNDVE